MCLCSHFNVFVVVNFLSHVIFCFSFVFGYGTTVLYMYKYMLMKLKKKKKEKEKIPEIKKKLTTTYPFIILYALFFIKHLNTVNTH